VQPAMMQALIERLQTTYPYSVMGYENRFGTTAIFSQHPFSEEHIVDLEADRPAVLVTTRIQNRDVTFISTHLLAFNLGFVPPADIPRVTMERTTEQNRQARIILEQLVSRQGIKIVGCDCNSYETSSSYRILNRTLTNAARQKGWTLNAPQLPHTRQDNDLQHIDFVLYQGGLQPINTFVIQESGGSDHYPVLSWFRLD
jgi:endonuclease/exonuclease/phosphatase (EEP) superfamily protein YafD